MALAFRGYKARADSMIRGLVDDTEDACRRYVEYALQGGKRVRCIVALSLLDTLQSDYVSPEMRSVFERACVSIELIHASSLILDDLPCMDDADIRRCRPSMHVKFGEACALLTSGHLLTTAIRLYCEAYKVALLQSPQCQSSVFVTLIEHASRALSFEGACGGQLIDLQLVSRISIEDAINRKTSSLFEIAFLTGFLMGHCFDDSPCDTDDVLAVRAAAQHFGLAFQIYDDFGDVHEDLTGNNYVLTYGKAKAAADFESSLAAATEGLRALGVMTDVLTEIMTTMRVSVCASFPGSDTLGE